MSSYSAATVITADSIEKDQRKALRSALHTAYRAKVDAAKKSFGLKAEDAPETLADFIQRIKDGKFEYAKGYDGEEGAYTISYGLRWIDPSVKVDKAGYKTARAALDEAFNDLDLRLAIIPVTDGLAALDAYKAPAAA